MLQINGLFPVPFAFDTHADPARLNAALRSLFIAREKEGTRYANPGPITLRNKPLFESTFHLFSWPEPEIAELREFCLSRVRQLVGEPGATVFLGCTTIPWRAGRACIA